MNSDWLETHALRYVAQQEASAAGVGALLERKVRRRCTRTGESPEAALELIPRTVERLVECNYVNDLRFAEGALERRRRRGDSRAQIHARLRGKGVPQTLLDSLFASEKPSAEFVAAWRFAKRRRLGLFSSNPAERIESRDRQLSAFSRAGFERELALQVVDANSIPELE